MQSRFRRLHIETRDGDGSIELDISREREIHKADGRSDRANLNAWLSQTTRAYAKRIGTGHSSASSQSKCSTNTADAVHMTGQASAQSTANGGQRTKLDLHEGD